MTLRQKIFAAIIAVMAIEFLLVAMVSLLEGLDARKAQVRLDGLDGEAARLFREAVASSGDAVWRRLPRELDALDPRIRWEIRGAQRGPAAGAEPQGSLVLVAEKDGFSLLRSQRPAALETAGALSGLFWAVAAGTVFLMLVVYGLLLRLVLRPVEDLVGASRALAGGGRPAKVAGESRTDEMGDLVRAFNRMAAEVQASRGDLERRVEEATREYRRAHEKLVVAQRLSSTGKLAAGLAHEINNPLGGMMNAARTLAGEKGLSERGAEYVALVQDGLERVRVLVERMRSFARERPAVRSVDLAGAVRGALSFARHRVEEEGVEVVEHWPDRPVEVTGDAGELQQVFLNLLLNALDAMKDAPTKRLVVGLAVSAASEDGRRAAGAAVVEIEDTGVGMDEERLAGAFDIFYSTKGEEGSGLGLPMAHKIVTDHGGELELESVPGRGTTARVRLPVERASE